MTPHAPPAMRLRAEIALDRYGLLPLACIALAIAAMLLYPLWVRPQLQQKAELLAAAAHDGAAASTGNSVDGAAQRIARIETALPASTATNELAAAVFSAAEAQGLPLEQSAYQYDSVPGLPWSHVSMSVPVVGNYPAVRRFVEDVLRRHPHVALDQLSFKREGTLQDRPEVLVGFSAWFASDDAAAVPGARP